MLIYHIVLPDIWAAFDTGLYRHASLADEGFIHCCFEEQLDGVIDRYYSGAENVIVLEIESERLMSRVIREPSTNSEVYPHIYGPINSNAVIRSFKRRIGTTD